MIRSTESKEAPREGLFARTATAPGKNPASQATARRLPWLDNNKALNKITKTVDRDESDAGPMYTLQPSPKILAQRSPKSAAPTTSNEGTKSQPPRNSFRTQSIASGSPALVPYQRSAQPPLVSIAHEMSSPKRTPATSTRSAFIIPQKRSPVSHKSPTAPKTNRSGPPSSQPSIVAPVPNGLGKYTSLDPYPKLVSCDGATRSSPAVVSRVQLSPSQPGPSRSVFERVGGRRISNAIEDLEDMVCEAVELAEDSTDRHQVEDIYEIIEDAKVAIQDASQDPARHLMITAPPLEVSDSSELISDYLSDDCHSLSHEHCLRNRTRAPPANVAQRNTINDVRPIVRDRENDVQRGPTSVDWAYHQREPSASSASSTSSSGLDDKCGHSNESSRSALLLPPQPIQVSPKDHTDFVLRPVTHEHSRGRSRRRLLGNSAVRDPKYRSRRSMDYGSRPRRRPSYKSSSLSRGNTFLDEEKPRARMYGGQLTVREQAHHHTFSLHRPHRRQPVARNWPKGKKRLTAAMACMNTALLGIIVGIYAGEVPRIQYFLADESHHVVIGNAVLYFGLAISTFVVWPLPLLHGRKPYLLSALVLALPLQFPQAIVVSGKRSPNDARFRAGLLCARTVTGLVLGFANVNYITVLLDLFGASLQSRNPHQEFVVASDMRRHGGGMGIWLGIWSWCWIGSLAVGFQIGAAIIESLTPDWGFYVVVICLMMALILNVIVPETRRAPYRRSVTEVYDRDENYITRRVSRGECKLHISTEGPKYWFEEVWAGMKLAIMMMCQPGFMVLSFYLGWIYAQIVLVIILLGALLSKDYRWQPRFVGAGVMSIAIGAFLAIPLTKAGIFSRERKSAFRTDSMTFQKQVTWSSHLIRRVVFTLTLPLMGLAYTVSAAGVPKPYMVPIVFAGALGFLSVLGIAECHGLIMETFDTCDLQPGVNTRHRLQSMAVQDRRRRTDYTSFPRITAGIFASQTIAFVLAGVSTLVGGSMTRRLGAQASTGVTAGILLGLTILLTVVLWRFREVQVIPNHTFGTRRDTAAWANFKELEKMGRGADWKAVVIGNPTGKMRRMSVLELGSMSRWTEIRKLNFLFKGPQLGEDTKKRRRFRESW